MIDVESTRYWLAKPLRSRCILACLPSLSWVWISASTTGRRSSMGIFGNENVPSVSIGNLVASRWALLAIVCTIMNVYWCVSWPLSNLYHPLPCYFNIWPSRCHICNVVPSAHNYVCHFEVEQPMSSCLADFPYVAHALHNLAPTFCKRMWMGSYNHWCAKPTQLFGTWSFGWIMSTGVQITWQSFSLHVGSTKSFRSTLL